MFVRLLPFCLVPELVSVTSKQFFVNYFFVSYQRLNHGAETNSPIVVLGHIKSTLEFLKLSSTLVELRRIYVAPN